jgi:hypothetical protein
MKRDLDLIRRILLAVEARQETEQPFSVSINGYSQEQICYHIRLLAEAGLLRAVDYSGNGPPNWQAQSLTWGGHDWLDATRSDTVWHKVKATVRDKGVSLTFELAKQLAASYTATALGLKGGS